MTKDETVQLIKFAGGNLEFAELLGLPRATYRQRVSNWRQRGMPAAVVLEHYDAIQRLKRRMVSAERMSA